MHRALILSAALLTGCPDVAGTSDLLPPPLDPEVPPDVVFDLPVCEGGVLGAFETAVVAPPASDTSAWLAPEEDTRAAIRSSFDALIAGEAPLAVGNVAVVGYELCRGDADENDLVLWRSAIPGTGRALFAWRFRGAHPAIIESPHGFVDAAGPQTALRTFEVTGARALIVAGTHPCANRDDTCGDGSAVCGGVPAASDGALNDASIFHLAHELFADRWADDWVISLQAMPDEGIAISDGTVSLSGDGAALRVGEAILTALPDQVVTSCNGLPGAERGARYCGTGAMQARHTNGALDPCEEEPAVGLGRYVQITRSPGTRAESDAVAQAIDAALSAR